MFKSPPFNLSFWRQTMAVAHSSTVFREAPASGSRFLRFSDERLETAEVLEVVLSLIVQARLLSSVVDDDDDFRPTSLMLNLWVDAVSFMTKWDCVSTLRVFELCVKELILCNHIDARPAFQLGLLADSPGICRAALEASEREGRAALSPYSSERRYIEIEELPFSFWEKVNPRYICALARAGAIKRADEAANFSTSLGRLFMLQLVVIEREQERR